MKKEFTQNQLGAIAQEIIAKATSKKLCFYGEMGSGKTTLIKALAKELSCNEDVSSPTFGIVNEYHKENGTLLAYHFDFYRLKEATEALDFGIEDYLNSNAWLFMEWPEKINSLLPNDTFAIHLKILDCKTRTISFTS